MHVTNHFLQLKSQLPWGKTEELPKNLREEEAEMLEWI